MIKLKHLLIESKNISITELDTMVKTSKTPMYIVVAGSVGSGKSYIVSRDLDIATIDPDNFTMDLGGGVYDVTHVATSMALVKKAVTEKLNNKQSFLQQGTSANLQSTINKLKVAKAHGFTTVMLYIDTSVEQAILQIEKRVRDGGHGDTINRKKVESTSAGAKLTFRALTGVDFDKVTDADLIRVSLALKNTENTIDAARDQLDYFIRIENKY